MLMLQHLINHKDRRGIRQILCTHQSLLCSVNPDMHGNIDNSNPEPQRTQTGCSNSLGSQEWWRVEHNVW